jgi:structural maintenance of chromosome 4
MCCLQGEMINESGTMSGGGGKPRGGRMCIGQAAPRNVDARAAAAELQAAENELGANMQVGGHGAGASPA